MDKQPSARPSAFQVLQRLQLLAKDSATFGTEREQPNQRYIIKIRLFMDISKLLYFQELISRDDFCCCSGVAQHAATSAEELPPLERSGGSRFSCITPYEKELVEGQLPHLGQDEKSCIKALGSALVQSKPIQTLPAWTACPLVAKWAAGLRARVCNWLGSSATPQKPVVLPGTLDPSCAKGKELMLLLMAWCA